MEVLDITIEDHVVPQLLTSALEAYEIKHKEGKKAKDKLETFGLLWGYSVHGRGEYNPRIISTVATIETSAKRNVDSVEPNLKSLINKREFFKRYWPHIDLIGTFHSHPYEDREDVIDKKGWKASTPESLGEEDQGDTIFWTYLHKKLCPDMPYLAHIIVTIAALKTRGWAYPTRFNDLSGFVLSSDYRKFWITSYGSYSEKSEKNRINYRMLDIPPNLDIPSLERRFSDN